MQCNLCLDEFCGSEEEVPNFYRNKVKNYLKPDVSPLSSI